MQKSIFIISLLMATSVAANDRFLCSDAGWLFDPTKTVEERCQIYKDDQQEYEDDYQECIKQYVSERKMYDNGKCYPIIDEIYTDVSENYEKGSCDCTIGTVQVNGSTYMVRFECPCSSSIPLGLSNMDRKFAEMERREEDIKKVYQYLPFDLYPENF